MGAAGRDLSLPTLSEDSHLGFGWYNGMNGWCELQDSNLRLQIKGLALSPVELCSRKQKGPSRKIAHDLHILTLVVSAGNISDGTRPRLLKYLPISS